MSEDPNPAPERPSLEIDLAMSFLPSWAKGSEPSDNASRLASRFGGTDDKKGFRDKGNRSEGPRRPSRDERPRRSGGPREEGRRDPIRREAPRREPEILPLEGWDIRFLPDRNGVEGLARQIKASAKAYPLFDLVRLVLEKSERYVVEFKRKDEKAQALFQVRADGTLWLSEADALSRALAANFDKFYRRETIQVEPPKGNFPCVAQCGMSDVLLGPPNYHDYPIKVRQLHAERFSHVPFDQYQSRIRMVKEEALIEQWRSEQTTREVYFPIGDAPAKPDAPNPAAVPTGASAEARPDQSPGQSPALASENLTEPPAAEETNAGSSSEVLAETQPAPEEAVTANASESETPIASPAQTEPSNAEAAPIPSYAEAERHFRQHYAGKAVIAIRDRVIAPGPAALNDSAPEVLALTRNLWEELNRFPLPVAHGFGKQLTAKGLQLFKDRDNVTVVSVARPKPLDYESNPVSDALRGMLEYLEKNPRRPRAEQWAQLVALRPLKEGETENQREHAVASDLSWLLREGHVIDFVKRGLEVVRRPPSKTSPTT
jgi:hypothetical protein